MDRAITKVVSKDFIKRADTTATGGNADEAFLQALSQGNNAKASLVPSPSSRPQEFVVTSDLSEPSVGPLEKGHDYGLKTGYLLRAAGAEVLSESAQGNSLLATVGSAVATAVTTSSDHQAELSDQMGALGDQSAEAKEHLEERIVARNRQEAVVDTLNFFSFGPFSWKYFLLFGAGFTLGISLALVFGKYARPVQGSFTAAFTPGTPPQLASQLRESVTETTRNFSLSEGFTTTVKTTESLQQQ